MKQKLLKTMLLLCALVVGGASSVWADETYSLTPNNSSTGSSSEVYITTLTEFTFNEIKWKMNQWNPKNLQVKTNQTSAASEFRFYNTTAFPRRIKQVVITFSALTVSDASKLMFKGGTSEVSTTSGGTAGTWNGTAKTLTWTPGSTDNYTYFAFYQNGKAASGTNYLASSDAIVVTYESAASATALAVKTEPTKTEYRVGEKIDFTGLVLNATVGGEDTDVTSGYTAKIGETSVTSGTTVLSEVGKKTVTFTYGGQTTTQDIYVGKLKGIAITTAPSKTTYDEGQSFSTTGMVVTATYTDNESSEHTWTQTVAKKDGESDGYTYSPTATLTTENTSITVSYTWGEEEKTANQAITVNAASAYTVTFNAGTGSCGTASLTEASAKAGVTLPTATIGVTGWSFAGWATASTTNTEDKPTLYAAGATYNPTEDCTLYAVYKFSEGTEGEYKRATSLTEIKASSQVILVNGGKTLTTDLSAKDALSESEGVVTAADKTVFTLSGNDTDGYVLSSASGKIGASSLPTSNGNSQDLAITNTNSTWSITTNSTENTFTFLNKGGTNVGLEYYSSGSKWVVYKSSSPTTSSYYSTKVYIPNFATVYNSNPAAIVNPTLAWTTSGDKSLYMQNTYTYDNAANVTGIAKTPVYTSSDETVATVSAAGVVTALKAGSTTITAKVAKEVGVNTEASVTYDVTVKDASNVAGIKAIASNASVVTFTADLTDAVVTYVNGSHAYIQDASGAVYASCGSSLTAGKKINGAVSGSVKAANKIDEITVIDLSRATVTDGVIPSATVITAATLAANKADYEGKLVSIEGATVTASLENGNASGGKISDDGKTTEINLYAPDSNIDALKDAEGTFNGYISLYGGTSIRFNIYEQSQITLTKNAPTAQPLAFASDAVELDEETDAYTSFAGQAVSGAVGDVTYSIDIDNDDVVTSINASTGAVVLSGNLGTATIKASAAAKEVTDAGVTTPYSETTKTYTITVYPRYTVTFSANGVETPVRQASHGAAVAVPSPGDLSGFNFMGWSATTVDLTDDAPSMESLGATVTPEDDATYYAVYAVEVVGDDETSEYYKNTGANGTSGGVTASGTTNSTASNGNPSPSFNTASASVTFTGINVASYKAASLKFDYKAGKVSGSYTTFTIKQYNSLDTEIQSNTVTGTQNSSYVTSSAIDMKLACTKVTITATAAKDNSFIDNIIISVTQSGTSYENYCTTIPSYSVTVGSAGYTTYVAANNVSFPDGATAYIATAVNPSTIHLEEVLAVPTGTAVIVKADAGTYDLTVEASADCDDISSNLLLASDGTVEGDGSTILALAKKGGIVGFYPVGDGVFVPEGKAYLDTDGMSVKDFLGFDFGEDGVQSVKNGQFTLNNTAIFNLAGQRMSKLQHGINIVNGKKIIIK